MHVLVIDDSRAMRKILGRMLVKIGASSVAEAADGAAALAVVQEQEPDLVLVDWHMPGMSGLEFLHAVRAEPYDYSGTLMMVTTETEIDQIGRALGAGADEYLMKPFTQEALADKLSVLGFEA